MQNEMQNEKHERITQLITKLMLNAITKKRNFNQFYSEVFSMLVETNTTATFKRVRLMNRFRVLKHRVKYNLIDLETGKLKK